jgi:DNA primase
MGAVDEIKDRLDAVELISNYMQLKRAGRSYKGLCPFHDERTPSFVVFPDTGTWHCFGACGEGGDVFSFVMKQEGWDFRTALQELARQAGVELKPRTPKQQAQAEEHAKLREILTAAAVYYHNLLLNAPQAQPARDYVAQRDLQERTVENFQLGYALDEWHALENFLTSKKYTRQELITAGLLVERDDGRVYDRFRGRLMIPIRDARGRTIGFGARTLDPNGVPKYLNSPQTPVFDKSRTLYGLDNAARGIRAADRAIIVEGYMDVLQAHQAGFTNLVAQLGTALSEENLQRLTRYTRRIVLALDPDTAGQAATMRGLDTARQALESDFQPVFDARGLARIEARLSADIRVLTLPPGKDPDDLLRHDPAQWAILVDQAVPLIEHYMRTVLQGKDLEDPKVKGQVTKTLVPVIQSIPSQVERDHYAQQLARTLRVHERALLDMVAGAPRPRKRQRPRRKATPIKRQRGTDLEADCLRGLLQNSQALEATNTALGAIGLEPISATDMDNPEHREIFTAWQAMVSQGLKPSPTQLAQAVPPQLHDRLRALLTAQNKKWPPDAQVDPDQDTYEPRPEEVQQYLVTGLLRLRERNLKRRSENIKYLLEDADNATLRIYQRETNDTQAALLRLHKNYLWAARGPGNHEQTVQQFTVESK